MNKKWFIVGFIDGGVGDDDDGSRRRIVVDIIVRTDTISIAMHIVNYAQFLKQTHYNNDRGGCRKVETSFAIEFIQWSI